VFHATGPCQGTGEATPQAGPDQDPIGPDAMKERGLRSP
jgi:hypothetical protein